MNKIVVVLVFVVAIVVVLTWLIMRRESYQISGVEPNIRLLYYPAVVVPFGVSPIDEGGNNIKEMYVSGVLLEKPVFKYRSELIFKIGVPNDKGEYDVLSIVDYPFKNKDGNPIVSITEVGEGEKDGRVEIREEASIIGVEEGINKFEKVVGKQIIFMAEASIDPNETIEIYNKLLDDRCNDLCRLFIGKHIKTVNKSTKALEMCVNKSKCDGAKINLLWKSINIKKLE